MEWEQRDVVASISCVTVIQNWPNFGPKNWPTSLLLFTSQWVVRGGNISYFTLWQQHCILWLMCGRPRQPLGRSPPQAHQLRSSFCLIHYQMASPILIWNSSGCECFFWRLLHTRMGKIMQIGVKTYESTFLYHSIISITITLNWWCFK